ncbi:PIN domain-containing protein [Sphaerisporangium sp. NPDC005289]|uniref:PIN domain-containing protein n=1 Tax=Sphaerisporangium sp. NPDC005289 TaxID=3155247 RepID=UPI0033A58782
MNPSPEYVLDSGALIALERADERMTALLLQVRRGQARLVLPDAVLAQVWRGGHGRQARLAALLGLKPEQCTKVPLDSEAAKRIGLRTRDSGHADVTDVHVAILGEDRGAVVITSDREDILRVSTRLKERLIEL